MKGSATTRVTGSNAGRRAVTLYYKRRARAPLDY